MDELVKLVSEKTGITEAQSKTAVETVINYLKEQLPDPIAGQIDSALGDGGGIASLTKGLGGFLGK